jgi:hypothetical protein
MKKTQEPARKAPPKSWRKAVAAKRKPVAAKPELAPVATFQAKVQAGLVDGSISYLEVTIREQVTEDSMVRLFESVRGEISRSQVKRVLVDLREGSVVLTISDLHGLAKMVATTFAGVLERFALVLRPQDVLAEKFFEPSVSNRGLPTFVTTDPAEAADWIAAKLRPAL